MLPLWLIGFLIFLPLTWITLNDVAWRASYGGLLTDRPLAAVHHRVMGTIQDFENAGDDIGYYDGHLRGFPDAASEDREAWQRALDEARHQQRLVIIKSALVGLLAYLPVGFILDRWLMGGRSADELVKVSVVCNDPPLLVQGAQGVHAHSVSGSTGSSGSSSLCEPVE